MRTVLKNSSEVCHVFASQSQPEGKCSNVFFRGKEIYSYGYHFCMAKILESSKVLITDRSYSVTTSKHLSEIRYALNHFDRLFVPHPESSFESNAKVWERRIKKQIDILNNPRKRPATKENAKLELAHIVSNVEKYIDWTSQKMILPNKEDLKQFKIFFEVAKGSINLSTLNEQLAKRAKLNEAANRKRVKELQVGQKDLFDRWLLGQSNANGRTIHTRDFNAIDTVGLRCVDGEIVETSKGASVSLKAAKVLFERIHAGKDVKGFEIDGYTVISMNGVLTIGCHEIERFEIERFAKTQNWI